MAMGCESPCPPHQHPPLSSTRERKRETDQGNRLDDHRLKGKETLDDEAREDAFNLGNAGAGRVGGVGLDDVGAGKGEEALFGVEWGGRGSARRSSARLSSLPS